MEDATTTGYQTVRCDKEQYHNMNTIANDVFHLPTLRLYQTVVHSQLSQYTRECNFMYTINIRSSLCRSSPIQQTALLYVIPSCVERLAFVQRNYVDIYILNFTKIWGEIWKSRVGIHPHTEGRITVTEMIFTNLPLMENMSLKCNKLFSCWL